LEVNPGFWHAARVYFSKKLANFQSAVALNFMYYNFCKRHIAVRMTPAQAAGIEGSQWTVAELVERCGE
jgi:hypothetical protein